MKELNFKKGEDDSWYFSINNKEEIKDKNLFKLLQLATDMVKDIEFAQAQSEVLNKDSV